METQNEIDFVRITRAIEFIKLNFKAQPSLDDVAAYVHLSPFHFQRMFKEWAGISPRQFLNYLSLEHAKTILNKTRATLFEVAFQTGLSGTGRLHDLFMKIEGMSPGEFKNGGAELTIRYSFSGSPFGSLLIASTQKGVCHLAFTDQGEDEAIGQLVARFPRATYQSARDELQENALSFFDQNWERPREIRLHLKGTVFQLKVWEALLKVPVAGLTTYAGLAQEIGNPRACRAVGSAVGDNPVAFLIPCHRVIRSTGETGQYHWGAGRKDAMNGWEAAKAYHEIS